LAVGWGHAPVIARSKPACLGRTRTLQEQNMLHEVEGHVPQAPSPAATQQRTWAPTGSAQDAGNLGSMSRLGKFVVFGVAPVQHPLLLEPAAARTSCSMVQNSKYYFATGQRGADGERAVASATTSVLHTAPNEKNAPHPPKHRQSLCLHPRGTHRTVTPKKPRGLGGMGKFSTLGVDGMGWPTG